NIGVAPLVLGPDGSLYLGGTYSVHRLGPDGVITMIAGSDQSPGEIGELEQHEGAPSMEYALDGTDGLAVAPDGALYIANYRHGIHKISSALPNARTQDIRFPSEDGRELYVFNTGGRHLRTLDTLTGSSAYQFGYDSNGYLTSITDRAGNVTTIERAGEAPSAIVAPGGQRTTLAVDDSGWLSQIKDPAGEAYAMTSSAGGLLTQFTDPRGNVHRFGYDDDGRLLTDEDPAGGSTTLSRVTDARGFTITTTSALGRAESFQVARLATGEIQRTHTDAS